MAAHYFLTAVVDQPGNVREVRGFTQLSVPGGNNDAGVPWATVAVAYTIAQNRNRGLDGTLSKVAVDAATQTGLDNGSLFEIPFMVTIATNSATPIADLEAALLAREAADRAALGALLRFYGFQGDT